MRAEFARRIHALESAPAAKMHVEAVGCPPGLSPRGLIDWYRQLPNAERLRAELRALSDDALHELVEALVEQHPEYARDFRRTHANTEASS